ncbi:MAG TPA: hypothetical protein VH370_11280 [Humisphaera sp.]|nr:hypothetical protein [Humisphaera sp.]
MPKIGLVWRRLSGVLLGLVLAGACVAAAPREQRVPLKQGTLHVADLSAAVCHEMDLPGLSLASGDVVINSPQGAQLIDAVNLTLGQAGHLSVDGNALLLRVDPDKLATRCDELARAARVLAAAASPDATLRQAKRWGLFVPPSINPDRPLIILIHGIDSDRGMLVPLADLLTHEGDQVGYFSYAGDQPIDDSAANLAQRLTELRALYPTLRVQIIAHSMGGLVARDYLEGASYVGGVDRLIMVGTPNAGSSWSKLRFILSIQQHYNLWRNDPDWSPSWYVTEGVGEAGRELAPESPFLKKMAALPRRAGVRYTVIAGTQHPASRMSAECFDGMAGWFDGRVGGWWGFRQCKNGLKNAADHYRHDTGESDGPVTVASAKLAGVNDVVLLPADHIALFLPIDGHPPVAWEAIKARVGK